MTTRKQIGPNVHRWGYRPDFGEDISEWREFYDTNDPYKLIAEAKEAREMLRDHYIKGKEFADECGSGVIACDDPNIKKVCAIGAVYYVQGHQVFECNLITSLNMSAMELFPTTTTRCENPDCDACNGPGNTTGSIVSVNDEYGRAEALSVFDHTIRGYQAQIDQAEAMASAYADKPYHQASVPVKPYTYTKVTVAPPATSINVNTPVPQEVHV